MLPNIYREREMIEERKEEGREGGKEKEEMRDIEDR